MSRSQVCGADLSVEPPTSPSSGSECRSVPDDRRVQASSLRQLATFAKFWSRASHESRIASIARLRYTRRGYSCDYHLHFAKILHRRVEAGYTSRPRKNVEHSQSARITRGITSALARGIKLEIKAPALTALAWALALVPLSVAIRRTVYMYIYIYLADISIVHSYTRGAPY